MKPLNIQSVFTVLSFFLLITASTLWGVAHSEIIQQQQELVKPRQIDNKQTTYVFSLNIFEINQ